jgi:CRP/FNR family cyclic AMP-dependent transcriptional regulator
MSDLISTTLYGVPLFAGLQESGHALLAAGARESTVRADHVIIREGEAGRHLFIIRRGTVRVYRDTPHGEVELNILKDGNFFGEMSVLEEMPRSASVQAVTEVSLVILSRVQFALLSEQYPAQFASMVTNLARDLSFRLRRLGDEFARQH